MSSTEDIGLTDLTVQVEQKKWDFIINFVSLTGPILYLLSLFHQVVSLLLYKGRLNVQKRELMDTTVDYDVPCNP